jgi:hypothetical protein
MESLHLPSITAQPRNEFFEKPRGGKSAGRWPDREEHLHDPALDRIFLLELKVHIWTLASRI